MVSSDLCCYITVTILVWGIPYWATILATRSVGIAYTTIVSIKEQLGIIYFVIGLKCTKNPVMLMSALQRCIYYKTHLNIQFDNIGRHEDCCLDGHDSGDNHDYWARPDTNHRKYFAYYYGAFLPYTFEKWSHL